MISVTIWRMTLVRNGACKASLDLFDCIAAMQPEADPRRLRRIRLTRYGALHWIMLVQAGYGEWLASRGIVPRANLRGANLADVNLTGAVLTGANLRGVNLRDAYRGHDQPPIPGWCTDEEGYLREEVTRG